MARADGSAHQVGTADNLVAEERIAAAELRAHQLEERLRARALLLGQFEHKLKTALSVIQGRAATLDSNWDRFTDEQRRQGLASVNRQAADVVTRAEGMLAEAHAELTALDLKLVSIDLAEALRVACASHEGATHGHTITYEGPDHLEAVVDPAALQQVLGQLLENAVKYSPGGGDIVLRAGAVERTIVIAVIDQGVGVPESIDIFEPFVRGCTGVAGPSGSGLGLYIVRNLAEAMGGGISARSNDDGVGSTFVLTLPA
jgi:signal transduction histidine kinase